MLCVTGQAGKAKERFVEFRAELDGNFAAMQAVISLLGYVGLLYDAFFCFVSVLLSLAAMAAAPFLSTSSA